MIGRGIFKDLEAFSQKELPELSPIERIKMCLKHTEMFKNTWGNSKKFDILKKYYKIYITDFDGAKDLRVNLMGVKNYNQAIELLNNEILSFENN